MPAFLFISCSYQPSHVLPGISTAVSNVPKPLYGNGSARAALQLICYCVYEDMKERLPSC